MLHGGIRLHCSHRHSHSRGRTKMVKLFVPVVALLALGVAAPHLLSSYSSIADLRGGWNGYSCENSLGTRCNIPANNDAYAEYANCSSVPVGQHGTFCTDDVDPRSCTVDFWGNCNTDAPSSCPSIDVICTLDQYNGRKEFRASGAGSPGCGTVTRCGS